MKLLDFLISKGRSGWCWPNGMAKATCNVGSTAVNFYLDYSCPPTLSEILIATCHFDEHSCISKEQYEAALAASKKEWDGDGLPPVGLPVELQYWNDGKVEIVRVIAYHGNEAWVEFTDDCRNMLIGNPQFRPIRSEADKKRDEAMRQLSHSLRAYGSVTDEQLNRLYNDIEAGFIPHIRID